MKKLLALSIFCLCVSVGFASTNTNTKPILDNNGTADQKSQKESSEKKAKYDFSLFKFITPAKQNSESDTLKIEKETPKDKPFSGETTELYEKPRCFLMFS
ncbi:MAG: hypothetical protein CMP59_02450 [Flavobacteriales bacterium]|nr:hypothetical protein [Flavobacteriales bacterium]